MLTGVLSCVGCVWVGLEMTAPVSFKKRVGAKPITVAPSGNMRNSFTFQSPQPTILQLATHNTKHTQHKNLPANSDIVMSIAESLVKTEYQVQEAPEMSPVQEAPMSPELSIVEREARREYARIFPGMPLPREIQSAIRTDIGLASPLIIRRPGMHRRTPGIPGIYGGIEAVADYPVSLPEREPREQLARQLSEQMRESYGP